MRMSSVVSALAAVPALVGPGPTPDSLPTG
jgi:hypothetical protein